MIFASLYGSTPHSGYSLLIERCFCEKKPPKPPLHCNLNRMVIKGSNERESSHVSSNLVPLTPLNKLLFALGNLAAN